MDRQDQDKAVSTVCLVPCAAPGLSIRFGGASESLDDQDYREAEIIFGWDAKVKPAALEEGS
ncbi:hypothetical protein [Paenibacillus harenae]|uniref:hypothetical protein n=1 Tax=Paenibacillus harenae TaxID=306543 RepID=UPI0027D7E3DD|nr:hypothetical protein [Paenibacillus harenae]